MNKDDQRFQMKNFLEACVLFGLMDEKGYGYQLCEWCKNLGFKEEEINSSTIYRILRKMEREGLVCSKWEDGCKGPKKRVYFITKQGTMELNNRIQIIQQRKKKIETLLEAYEERKKE